MKPKVYTSTGIVLSRRDLADYDRIITLFSEDYGKQSLVAKGVKRPTSKKRGSLEVFNLIKYSGVRGNGMDIMTEAQSQDDFASIRSDLSKISVAYYLLEATSRLTLEEEKNVDIYRLLKTTLEQLATTSKLRTLKNNFVYEILVLTGFWPEGKEISDHDRELEVATERKIASIRIGKKVLS